MSKKVNLVIAIQQLTDEQLVSSIKKYIDLISAYNRYVMLAKRELKHRKRKERLNEIK